MKKIMLPLIAFVVGIIPGFFIVFNAVFTDSSGAISERLVTFALVIAAYLVLGLILGMFQHWSNLLLALFLALPAILILVLYTPGEPQLLLLNIIYLLLTFLSSWAGVHLGTQIRRSKK